MKIRYSPDTDSLSINLNDSGELARSEDITPDGNVRARYSAAGELLSIEVSEKASELFDLSMVGVTVVRGGKAEARSFTPLI